MVAPDRPGFGDADKPADWRYTVTGYAGHLNGIPTKLGIERAHPGLTGQKLTLSVDSDA
jgi:pimeloyl-ACP methyl ester carboxylesterase